MNKQALILLLILAVILAGCGEGTGYNYEHLNNQDISKLNKNDPAREKVGADNVSIGGNYEHLNRNFCDGKPECCGEFSSEEKWYNELQQRAAIEQNPELCLSLPDEPFVVDCPGEPTYDYYNKETCLQDAQ